MEVFNNFFSLLSDVWKDGISGASFTDIVTALAVFFIFTSKKCSFSLSSKELKPMFQKVRIILTIV